MLKRAILAAGLAALAAAPARAADAPALVTFKQMTLETALKLAQATLDDCRKKGFQVAVAVVDRSGVLQVSLRDRFAGAHTPETARRKAWTAVSFRTDTMIMAEETQAGKMQSGVRFVGDGLMIGGGVPVESAGSIVGGIGVSGAPGGDEDDRCARVGIESIADLLAF
ncbi:MAG: heme-binding protein [Rhodospirillaceae bacterium]